MLGLEPLIASATTSIIALAWETLSDSRSNLLENFGIPGQTLQATVKQMILRFSQEYARNYVERYGILRILGKPTPALLDSFYIPLQVWQETDLHRCESMEMLDRIYDRGELRRCQFIYTDRQEAVQATNQHQYLMILGEPGAGKSTFLRHIGLEVLKGKKVGIMGKSAYIPIFINLREQTDPKINLKRIITQEFRRSGFPLPDQFTTKALAKGKLLILLDGLNELSEAKLKTFLINLQSFIVNYPKNRIIASCRTSSCTSNLTDFKSVVLSPFEDSQIEQFLGNWFQGDPHTLSQAFLACWEALQKSTNAAAKNLARNPLCLALLCLVYERSHSFPKSRQTLYQQSLQILLKSEVAQNLLAKIAYKSFEQEGLTLEYHWLLKQVKNFFENDLKVSQYLNSQLILEAVAIRPELLVKQKEKTYKFSHPTFQEYLTAYSIKTHQTLGELISQHWVEERWQPIFLQLAELMAGEAEELLLQIESEAQKYINTPKLQALLSWANQVTESSKGLLKPAAKRAAAILISGSDFAVGRDITDIHGLISRDCTLTRDFDSTMTQDRLLASYLAQLLGFDHGFILAKSRIIASNLTGTLGLARTSIFADELTRELAGTVVKVRGKFLDLDLNFALDSSRDLALDRTRDFALVYLMAREYEKLQISNDTTRFVNELDTLRASVPGNNEPLEVHQDFRGRLRQTWLNTFHLTPDLIDLSPAEKVALSHYLYANCLMVLCWQAAGKVAPETWEAIESRMLLVPES